MFSSQIASKDMNRNSTNFLQPNNFKHISSSTDQGYVNQSTQSNGLARYRSAPSSFFATLLNSDAENSSSGDDESEAMISAFTNGTVDLNQKNDDGIHMQYVMKQEIGSYSVGMESGVHVRSGNGNGNCSNLARQSSSPAGFFHGFSTMGELGNYRVQNHSDTSSSANGLSNHVNFSSGPSSSLTFLPSIPEAGNENIGILAPENCRLRNGNISNGSEFEASASWNESHYDSLKRNRDGEMKMFSNYIGTENMGDETMKISSSLVHHLSLPKTPSEMANVEKFLQFQQENVPCQTRAKRGRATHPRSIAERVRRTKISEKIKTLQDLFPDIDKQANTADMLDLAVQYIKDLQKKVQVLTDTRSKCVCSSRPQQSSSTT